jgi:hypothetical protein
MAMIERNGNERDLTAALLLANPAPIGRETVWAQALAFLDSGHLDASVAG